jgi:hypothetical protein
MYLTLHNRACKVRSVATNILWPFLLLTIAVPVYAQTAVVIQSGSPVHVADYKKGDSVSIEASLSTSDPDEGPENEPLIIQGTTGFSQSIAPYNTTFVFHFVAPDDGSIQSYISGYDGDEVGTVKVNAGKVEKVQIICRPLDPATGSTFSALLDDLFHIRQRLGRHAYALITFKDTTKATFGAYDDSNGILTSAKNGDPVNPPGGCGGGGPTGFGLASDCLTVPTPPSGDDILVDFEALVPNSEGPYDPITNNSNHWMDERIHDFPMSVSLPASAITNKVSFCAQVPNIIKSLQMAGVPQFLINKLKAHYMPVTCP